MKRSDSMKVANVVWVYKKDDDAVLKWVEQANWEDLPNGCKRNLTLESANLNKEHCTVGAWGSIVMHNIDTSFENLYSAKVIIFI